MFALGDMADRPGHVVFEPSLTFVFDALDEAAPGQTERIVNEIVRPLAKIPKVKVLAGTRRSLSGDVVIKGEKRHGRLRAVFGPGAHILDLADEPETEADIAKFVRKRLRASSARGSDAWIDEEAGRIASAARGSFLYARLVARSLEESPNTRLETLPSGASAAFLMDIQQRFPGQVERITDLLRALAFGRGKGLSRAVWPAIATAISNRRRYNDDDIVWMLSHAAFYIVETGITTGGVHQGVYRLIHQFLADYLRRWPASVLAHTRIVSALTDGLKGVAWLSTDAYLRRHLAEHAVAADSAFAIGGASSMMIPSTPRRPEGRFQTPDGSETARAFDWLLLQPGYLAVAEPEGLLGLLPAAHSDDAQEIARIYLLAATELASLAPLDRWAFLHLVATSQQSQLALGCAPPASSSWNCQWAKTRPLPWPPLHRILPGQEAVVTAVAIGAVDGEWVVLSGGADHRIRRWDARTGTLIGRPLAGHTGAVTSIAVGTVEDRPVVVSGSADRTVRLWDARTGAAIREPIMVNSSVTAVAIGAVANREVVVSGSRDANVRLWDARTGALIGWPLAGHEGPVFSVSIGAVDGKPVVVSGGLDKTVRLWNAETGAPIFKIKKRIKSDGPLLLPWGKKKRVATDGHTDLVYAVAVGTVEGRPVVVSGSADRTVRLWNARTGAPIRQPIRVNSSVTAVAIGAVADWEVVVSGSRDNTIRLWNARTGALISQAFAAHIGGIRSVAVGAVDCRLVVVSGGLDETIRFWDVPNWLRISRWPRHPAKRRSQKRPPKRPSQSPFPRGQQARGRPIYAMAIGTVEDRLVAVSKGVEYTLRLQDVCQGRSFGPSLRGHANKVTSVSIGTLDGQDVVVSGSRDMTIRLWNVRTGALIAGPLKGHEYDITSVAVGAVDGEWVVLSGGADHRIRRWDARTGTLIGRPLAGHTGAVTSIAVGTVEDRPVVVSGSADRTVRLWDARTGALIGEPLKGHSKSVNAVAIGSVHGRPMVASGSWDRTVRIAEDLERGFRWSFLIPVGNDVRDLAFDPGECLYVAHRQGIVKIRIAHRHQRRT